jgi:AcrR family transcriptional regulator
MTAHPRMRQDGGVTQVRQRAAHLGPDVRRPMVLDAALTVYLRDGIDATTMEAIAAEAQVSKPVVYACFPNRDAVLEALIDRNEATVMQHVAAAVVAAQGPDETGAALRAGFTALFDAVRAEPDAYRASVLLEQGASLALARRLEASRAMLSEAIGGPLAATLAERGTPISLDAAHLIAHTVAGLGRAYIVLILSDGDRHSSEMLAGLAASAVLAIGAELGVEIG